MRIELVHLIIDGLLVQIGLSIEKSNGNRERAKQEEERVNMKEYGSSLMEISGLYRTAYTLITN